MTAYSAIEFECSTLECSATATVRVDTRKEWTDASAQIVLTELGWSIKTVESFQSSYGWRMEFEHHCPVHSERAVRTEQIMQSFERKGGVHVTASDYPAGRDILQYMLRLPGYPGGEIPVIALRDLPDLLNATGIKE